MKIHERVVTSFAIIMIVSAAILSYFVVSRQRESITQMQFQMQKKETLLSNIWENIAKVQYKVDTAILLSILSDINKPEVRALRKDYLSQYPELKEDATVSDILGSFNQYKDAELEYIDSLYVETVYIKKDIANLQSSTDKYSNLAFFLQTFGLVLIIIRKDVPFLS